MGEMRLAFALLWGSALALANACLVLGESDTGGPSGGGGAGGGGGAIGDGSWPDGNSGGSGATTSGGGGSAGSPSGGGGSPSGGGGSPSGGGAPSGGGGSGGSGGGSVSWTLFSYDWGSGVWSAPTALELVWSGTNAPPSTGIASVVQLEHYDRLLVFTDSGQFHVRSGSAWKTPVATSAKFPELGGLTPRSTYHVASPTIVAESITIFSNPTAVIYDYKSDDSVVFEQKVTVPDEAPPGPPQGTGTVLWDFEVRDPSLYLKSGDWYRAYAGYANGNVYQLDGAFVWKSWPMGSAPFFAGKPNAPDPLKMRAAWFDAKLNRAYFVGPV